MTKPRITLLVSTLVILIALGGIFYFYSLTKQEPAQLFPAAVNRDCAPWDGAAFTIIVQYDSVTTITISIWKSPDILFPSTFALPDDEGQIGNAYILLAPGSFVQLDGEVSFQRVEEGMPLDGRFIAEWGSQVVYCG